MTTDQPFGTTERESAATEARERGMAFLVDGKHVSADRVMILSVPDTIGPIANMRRAKIDAQVVLEDMALTMMERDELVRLRKSQASNYVYGGKQDYDKFREHAFILSSLLYRMATALGQEPYKGGVVIKDPKALIDSFMEKASDDAADAQRIDWFDKRGQLSQSKEHMRWVLVTDSGITNVRLAMDSMGALAPVPLSGS